MSESSNSGAVQATVAQLPNRRGKRRARISQPVRARPSEPMANPFDEVRATINVCRDGLYFDTELNSYKPGMRLFITFPFHQGHNAINLEYIGRVVRVDAHATGRQGVAVQLLMTCNLLGGQARGRDIKFGG